MSGTNSNYTTPGQRIEDLLAEHGWSKRTLAIIIGIDEATINKVILGKRLLSPELALAFGDVFGETVAEELLGLQKQYDLAQARLRARPDPKRALRASMFGSLPILEMIKRGWVEAESVKDVESVERSLIHFFGAESADQIEEFTVAAKKTDVFGDTTPVQRAWLRRAKVIASEMLAPRYAEQALKTAVSKLKTLLSAPDLVRSVPRLLHDCGIRFMLIEKLPGAKMDGACFWLNDTSPVVAMSMQYDRIDNFWFVLRHELEHVLRGDGKKVAMFDADVTGDCGDANRNISKEEQEANAAAAEFCVPQQMLKQFISRKAPFFAERDILGLSAMLKVHPGLIAGQLQHETGRYDRFRKHQVKIRSHIAPSAYVDGWGDVIPVG